MAMIQKNQIQKRFSPSNRGFALLIAVVFMSVMLSFGLALGSLGYKQQVLASSAIASQYAFYAADAALECALYADQSAGQNIFAYPASDPSAIPEIVCDNISPIYKAKVWSSTEWVVINRLSLDSNKRCADVTVYKYKDPQPPTNMTTRIFSQGYDVPCTTVDPATHPSGARFVARGMSSYY